MLVASGLKTVPVYSSVVGSQGFFVVRLGLFFTKCGERLLLDPWRAVPGPRAWATVGRRPVPRAARSKACPWP
jgi:hypothetical protein